jgi:hypothetical protein
MGERGIRTLVLSLAGFGAAIGVIDITVVAAAREAGSAPLGGVLLALLSAGSIAGGLWYGSRAWRLDTGQRFVRILALFALVSTFLPLARPLPLLGIVVAVAGLLLSPLESSAYLLASQLAPEGTQTEAASWVTTASNVTAAAGIAVAGLLVGGPGVAWALVAAWGSAVLALVAAVAGRRALSAPPVASRRHRDLGL